MDMAKKAGRGKAAGIVMALLAAVFYALNMPFSKLLLSEVPPAIMAGLLYLGAGLGVGALFLLQGKDRRKEDLLRREDLPYVLGMVALDIGAPLALMYGLSCTTAANAALLNNFEIAATALIALLLFGEKVSPTLWGAILLVTAAGAMLTVEDLTAFRLDRGALFVLLAAACWGLENNCTRKISERNTYEIVTVKGLCSGAGSLIIGLISGQRLTDLGAILPALLLGFAAYGLSIFFYIRAQQKLGAAKTGAFYAAAPFVGALLSFLILREPLSLRYGAALLLMIPGSALAALDALRGEGA